MNLAPELEHCRYDKVHVLLIAKDLLASFRRIAFSSKPWLC